MAKVRAASRPLLLRFRPGQTNDAEDGSAAMLPHVPSKDRAMSVLTPPNERHGNMVSWVDEVRCAFVDMFSAMYVGYRRCLSIERTWNVPQLKRYQSDIGGTSMPAAKQKGHLLEDGTLRRSIFAANGRVMSDSALAISDYAGEQEGVDRAPRI